MNDHAEAPNGSGPDAKKPGDWLVLPVKLFALAAAVGVLLFGLLLLWNDLRGTPVAAGFTRVGGPTRVETAVDASRFWLTPPPCVVYAPAEANQTVMFKAAGLAMAHDAPLLFISQTPWRHRLVDRTVAQWHTARCKGPGNPAYANRPSLIVRNHNLDEPCGCVLDRLFVSVPPNLLSLDRLSTLAASNQLIPRPPALGVRGTLAPFVVFAVVRGPRDSPDVAVGLALAAHLAMRYPAVSLVVVPRYLEADSQLESELRSQRDVVEGGVVLGSTGILSGDTQTLLRLVLTSTDRQGVLNQLGTNLGSVGPIMAALLALIGGIAAVQIAPRVRDDLKELDRVIVVRAENKRAKEQNPPGGSGIGTTESNGGSPDMRLNRRSGSYTEPPPAKNAWIKSITSDGAQPGHGSEVTVLLHSGWMVTGRIATNGRDSAETVLRLDGAKLTKLKTDTSHQPDMKADVMVVPVQDIEWIGIDLKEQSPSANGQSASAPLAAGPGP